MNDLVYFITPMKLVFLKHEYYQNRLLGLDPYHLTTFKVNFIIGLIMEALG